VVEWVCPNEKLGTCFCNFALFFQLFFLVDYSSTADLSRPTYHQKPNILFIFGGSVASENLIGSATPH
jgi:hypothetical protein